MYPYSYVSNKEAFSHQKSFIGGFQVHIYNAVEIIEQAKQAASDEFNVNVAYLLHPRGRDSSFCEPIAYNMLTEFYKENKDKHLICVAWDAPNHGSRSIDPKRVDSWDEGNDTHGIDMTSGIDLWVEEVKVVMENLGAVLNLEYYLPKLSATNVHEVDDEEETEPQRVFFHNVVSGYLQGAHTAIRFGSKYPRFVDAVNPVIGCSDLTSLLIDRVNQKVDESGRKKFYLRYDELELTEEQQEKYYPKALHQRLAKQDKYVFEGFEGNGVKVFAAFSRNDPLVPPSYSTAWINVIRVDDEFSELFTVESDKHEVTIEMVEKFVDWWLKFAK